jgi:hypothetical protein
VADFAVLETIYILEGTKLYCAFYMKRQRNVLLISSQMLSGDKMIHSKTFFKNGVLEKDALVAFVKEVKKYPGLSDEDAALLAAQKYANVPFVLEICI